MSKFYIGQTVRIIDGKYSGAAGVVHATRENTGMVKVSIQGIVNNEPVDAEPWLKPEFLGAA